MTSCLADDQGSPSTELPFRLRWQDMKDLFKTTGQVPWSKLYVGNMFATQQDIYPQYRPPYHMTSVPYLIAPSSSQYPPFIKETYDYQYTMNQYDTRWIDSEMKPPTYQHQPMAAYSYRWVPPSHQEKYELPYSQLGI
ncbi:hypothetical protein BC941DRAFT_456226 [Chlamydoabsidia padenii]|nr:hypothetical protein BC941DRAFT_456226 [Chlamydoabsidia padenii]